MTEMETYHNNLLVEEQQWIAKQAELDKQIDELKPWIVELLEDNHPNELARLTGEDEDTCLKIVHQLYMEGFNDRKCWEPERVGDIWVIFGKNFSGEWIDENGDYVGFETRNEAMQYIKETFK